MQIFSCNSNKKLSKKIADSLGISLGNCTITRFADKEIFVEIHDNVRGNDVYVVQSTSFPANDHIMELLIMVDALKRASAGSITAVIPYYGYARQDRMPGPRTPITAKLVADLIEKSGIDRVLTVDLHVGQIQGFFDIPVDNLFAVPSFIEDIKINNTNISDVVIVSPDVGGVVRARALAKKIDADLAIIDKRREKAGISEVMNIIGDISEKDCILVDDIIDSGGTLCNAAKVLIEKGASSVTAYVTHAVLTGNAIEKIANSQLKSLIVTDTIQRDDITKVDNIRQISISKMIAEAMKRIHESSSVSSLFI